MAKRSITDKSQMQSALTNDPSDAQRRSSLHEAYKKHTAELVSIEDRIRNASLIILGIFAAGVKPLASLKGKPFEQSLFTLLVVLFAWFAIHLNLEYRNLRIAVRDLLVRCEVAMEFYKQNVFLSGDKLYTNTELFYPTKGNYLWLTSVNIVCLAALGLICLIWA